MIDPICAKFEVLPMRSWTFVRTFEIIALDEFNDNTPLAETALKIVSLPKVVLFLNNLISLFILWNCPAIFAL